MQLLEAGAEVARLSRKTTHAVAEFLTKTCPTLQAPERERRAAMIVEMAMVSTELIAKLEGAHPFVLEALRSTIHTIRIGNEGARAIDTDAELPATTSE